MNKHNKFDMLVAKGRNMDLVILLNYKELKHWVVSPNAYPPHNKSINAFLCLPKHEDACLEMLNGGKAEIKNKAGGFEEVVMDTVWNKDGWYMREEIESRC